MHVEFHPAALLEAEDDQSWYAERSVFAASAVTRELSLAIQRVAEAPDRYPAAEARTRKALLDRFPFTLYYRATPEVVSIIAVAHQKASAGLLVFAVTLPRTDPVAGDRACS